MTAGQNTWKGQAVDTSGAGGSDAGKNYIVQALIEKGMSKEYRRYSAIGALAKPVKGRMVGDKQMRDQDVAASAVVASKTITKGDECRFSLVRNITGATTFGDTPIADGDFLSYLHANLRLNKTATPAFQLTEEMSKMRAMDLVAGEESELRQQITLFLAEEYTYEAYRGLLKGRSLNLAADFKEGGLALDMGRGAGKAISPSRVVIVGQGEVTPPTSSLPADLDTYETAIQTALDAQLVAVAANPLNGTIEKELVTDIRNYIIDQKIKGVMVGGKQKWFVPCDPAIIRALTKDDGDLYEAWKISLHHDKTMDTSEIYQGVGHIELEDLVFFKDPYLSQFRPSIDPTGQSGDGAVIMNADGTVKLGCDELRNPRAYTPLATDVFAPMLVLGEQALLEANTGKVETMKEEGKFKQGASIASTIKQAFMRTRFLPKDGSTEKELNQSMALFYVNAPNAFTSFTKTY